MAFDLLKFSRPRPHDERRQRGRRVDRLGRGHGFLGHTHPISDFAQHLVDELDMIHNVPESVSRFFNYKAFARELFMSDYDMDDGSHVFSTC